MFRVRGLLPSIRSDLRTNDNTVMTEGLQLNKDATIRRVSGWPRGQRESGPGRAGSGTGYQAEGNLQGEHCPLADERPQHASEREDFTWVNCLVHYSCHELLEKAAATNSASDEVI